ncbi:hypothetical protein NHQ30_004073 [Ciborinia camelliae]|nr:hypothetical protein NHQ30_004073 [Ciborinia camelliae]
MSTEDHIMTDVHWPELSVSGRTQMEAMREILESKLVDINKAIERGMENIRIEVSSQIETIHISVDGRATRTSSGGGGFLGRFMTGSENTNQLEEDPDGWKKKNQKLEEDCRSLKRDKTQDMKTIQELRSQLQQAERDARNYQEIRIQLDSMTIKNRQLQEQTQTFRDIIINKGSGDIDDVDDNTIIKDFVALREQIQRIVNRYYKCTEDRPRSLNEGRFSKRLEKRRRKFFSMWEGGYTSAQLRNRSRAIIFEILATEILQVPIFGLDGFEKGALEHGLVDFELELEHALEQGHADVSSWRILTMKCASLLQQSQSSKSSIQPERVATIILDFMAPLQPHDKKLNNELDELLCKLCVCAFKLALTLRKCKDTYKCEIAGTGDRIDEETMEPQESEASEKGRKRDCDMKVAYVISGCLFKVLEVGDIRRERTVLEKAHIVITD